jgi:hypothetical protein
MKAFSTRIKKIEAAVRERYGKVIQDMAEKKFIAALKSAPPWVPEAYAFYFTMISQANRSLKESQPHAPGQGTGRPMHPKAYAFLLQAVEGLLREHRGERVGREEIKALFLSVIKNSPYLGEESGKVLLKAASTTFIQDEDIRRIHGE